MGGKKKTVDGRALIKSRFSKNKQLNKGSFIHTSDLNDGTDWNRLNLTSVTEQDSLENFLSTAELAGTEFKGEKLNISYVNPKSGVGLLSSEERKEALKLHEKYKDLISIPRRPKWDKSTTGEQLQEMEKKQFLEWRRGLALFQENSENVVLTPYEKNLEFWRQLWRVVEKSDVVVQIVDARNPLLFRCEDLEKYVKEVDENKLNMILCNKADFLTRKQRRMWAKYFDSIGVSIVFFSAIKSSTDIEEEVEEVESDDNDAEDNSDEKEDKVQHECNNSSEFETDDEEETVGGNADAKDSVHYHKEDTNSFKLFNREELIEFLRTFPRKHEVHSEKSVITIGLVGYPNVGKSSTINTLLTYKKVSVSATPGKTKHFQTVYLDRDILLCDCPGLVMPTFVLTKAHMIINGILPIDQMRDHVPPVNLLCTLIPRHVLENKYSIMIPKPLEGENPDRPPHSEELLNAYAHSRGFMTSNGEPDNSRAARYVLKDFINGKLLYCNAPPNIKQENFHIFENSKSKINESNIPARTLRIIKPFNVGTRDLEYSLFKEKASTIGNIHLKGYDKDTMLRMQIEPDKKNQNPSISKPWKNHKEKRNKGVKSRIKYKSLDE